MDAVVQVLKTRQIGFVKFGEPDFTQLTGVALVIIAIVLISVFTMKEAQEQREHRNEMEALSSEPVSATTYEAPAEVRSVSSPAPVSTPTPQAATPQSTKKSARARTPSRGRTPKKETGNRSYFLCYFLNYFVSHHICIDNV